MLKKSSCCGAGFTFKRSGKKDYFGFSKLTPFCNKCGKECSVTNDIGQAKIGNMGEFMKSMRGLNQ